MKRLHPRGIEPSATDGFMLKTVDGTTVWVEDPPPTVTFDGLTDVDTSTNPPIDGDSIVWDATLGQWVPYTTPEPEPEPPDTCLVPLTTVVAGVPELVWDENNNLVLTEVVL